MAEEDGSASCMCEGVLRRESFPTATVITNAQKIKTSKEVRVNSTSGASLLSVLRVFHAAPNYV